MPKIPPPNVLAVKLAGPLKAPLLDRLEEAVIRGWRQFRERS
jgi:hypothetical protein